MPSLLFNQRYTAKQAIQQVENLVAVLTQRSGPDVLLVYLAQAPAGLDLPHHKAIALRDLANTDLDPYDDLVIGFNSLDTLHGRFITKGPSFFPIEGVFFERGEAESLFRTMSNLSVEVMRRLKEVSDASVRAEMPLLEAKALQLALPAMLQDRECAGLLAIIPDGELNRFISRRNCHYLYLSEQAEEFPILNALLDTRQNWVVTFEELAALNPLVQNDSTHFLELRAILERMNQKDALQATRKRLAKYIYQLGGQAEKLRSLAWALAAEYWLSQIECDDLVALSPHSQFETFLETGASLRIYRNLESRPAANEHPSALNQSLREFRLSGVKEPFGQLFFAFPGIESLLPGMENSRFSDLCRILSKAGQEKAVARTLWLLAHDFLHGLQGVASRPSETRKIMLDACSRACLIYNLSDPWTWRQGRWQLYLEGAYQTRSQLLAYASQAESALDDEDTLENFYTAQSLWFGCAETPAIEKNLSELLSRLAAFQRDLRNNPAMEGKFHQEEKQAKQLAEVAAILLNRTSDGPGFQPAELDADLSALRESIPHILQQAADLGKALPLISSLCVRAALQLRDARRNRQNLYSQDRSNQLPVDKLQKLGAELVNKKRQFFIPIHEQRALEFAFDQEIQVIENLVHEIESSAKLNVTLRNPRVDIHIPVHLMLRVANQGRVEARMIEMILDHTRGFQLLDPSPVREIPILLPGAWESIDYYIQPEKLGGELRLEFSFNDRSGQRHNDAWTTYLSVQSKDSRPFSIKVIRHQYGRPIQRYREFYGRRTELQNILSLLKAGGKQNILLRGPRRMGKTSLLYMVQAALQERAARRFFMVPLDWDETLDRVHPVFLSLHSISVRSGENAARQFFRTLLERTGDVLQTSAEARNAIMAGFAERVETLGAVNAALEQIKKLLDPFPNHRIAVLLDEYDEVYQSGSGEFDRQLREFVSSEQRLTWIIASTMALYQEVKTISSPWFNVFAIIELSVLSEEAARDLVEGPTVMEDITWQSDATEALLDETGRHPFFIQLFCANVIAYLNQEKTNYVLQQMIFSIADRIVDERETANDHLEYFWKESKSIGQLALLLLDDQDAARKREEIRQRLYRILQENFGSRPRQSVQEGDDQYEWQEREFRNEIEWAEEITKVVSLDTQKRYIFTVPLFRRWLRRRRQDQDLLAETLGGIARKMENDGIPSYQA